MNTVTPSPAYGESADEEAEYFDVNSLPSVKFGTMTLKDEALHRRRTCRFIEEAGRSTQLKLPRVAQSTAMVFFHRFYAKHKFEDHDRFEVAVASILLAAKTEESPKRLNDVIQQCYQLKTRGTKGASGSEKLDTESEEFSKLKERVLLMERIILHTIGFELSVEHPYKSLVEKIRSLVSQRELEYIEPSTDSKESTSEAYNKMKSKLLQTSMNFANDSMQTTLCLQFQPQEIATAIVYLAGQFVKVKPTGGKTWLEVLKTEDLETLASISIQILELIMENKGRDQVACQKIRANIDQLGRKPRARPPPPRPPSEQPDAKRLKKED